MGYEVKYPTNCQFKHGLSDSIVKIGIILTGGAHRSKKHVLFWAQK